MSGPAAIGPLPDRELDLPLRTAIRRVRLAAGTAGDVMGRVRFSPGPTLDDLVFSVLEAIDLIDDEPPGYDEAVEIVQDSAALGRLLSARNRWLGELRTRARFRARCPQCRERDAVLELVTVALALSSPLPPLTMAGGALLAVPALASPRPAGRRWGGTPAAAELAVELPSGRLAPAVDLQPVTTLAVLRNADDALGRSRQDDAWTRLVPPDSIPEPDHAHRHRGSPGFTAILRMASALARLDDRGDVEPEAVEELSVADFLALDAAYHLAANADQPRAGACTVVCENCDTRYLPLLGS